MAQPLCNQFLDYPTTLSLPSSTPAQSTKSALNVAVAAQVESTRSGLAMLQAAQASIEKLRDDFEAIDALCRECASLIQSHDKIQLLSEVHFNIQQTLKVE